jgi:hypothetical protein
MVKFRITKQRVRYAPADHLSSEEFNDEVMSRYDKAELVIQAFTKRLTAINLVYHLEPEGVTLLYKRQLGSKNVIELYGGETKHRDMAESKLKECVRSYLGTRCIEDIQ